jgi:hypothetical protein
MSHTPSVPTAEDFEKVLPRDFKVVLIDEIESPPDFFVIIEDEMGNRELFGFPQSAKMEEMLEEMGKKLKCRHETPLSVVKTDCIRCMTGG